MRLVLDAHQVPEELMPMPVRRYILTADEKALTPNQKMLLAQKILFDDIIFKTKKALWILLQFYRSASLKERLKSSPLSSACRPLPIRAFRMYSGTGSMLFFALFGCAFCTNDEYSHCVLYCLLSRIHKGWSRFLSLKIAIARSKAMTNLCNGRQQTN